VSGDQLWRQRDALQTAGATSFAICRSGEGLDDRICFGEVGLDTAVELGSITKVVTGLLLAVAAAGGEVTLEDPLGRYLTGAGRVGAVTLESLATHASGLPRMSAGLLVRALVRPSDPYLGLTSEKLTRYASRCRLRPGGSAAYSNIGVALLGRALAAAAGADYWELARERVLGPLGMIHSGDLPDSHTWTSNRLWDTAAVGPAGGLRGPLRDLHRLATWARTPSDTPLGRAFEQATTPRSGFGTDQVGLCWMTRETPMGPVLWHNGGTGSAYAFLASSRTTAVVAGVGSKPSPKYGQALWRLFEKQDRGVPTSP